MKSFLRIIFVVVIPTILVAFAAWYAIRLQQAKNASIEIIDDDSSRIFVVKRSDMILGVRLNGDVLANKKHKVALEASYSTKILEVIDENAHVRKGDILVSFDDTDLKERIDGLTTNLSSTEEELTVAEEDLKIQTRSNAVSLREAEDRVHQATSALQKYLRLTRASNRNNYDLTISNATVSLATARRNYSDRKDEISKTSASDDNERKSLENELSRLKDSIKTAENSLDSARNNRKSFKRYDDPIKLMSLNNELTQAELNLDRTKISTSSNLLRAKMKVDRLASRKRRQELQLARYQSYLPMMKIYSPADGVVIYGDPDKRWGYTEIKPGRDVRKGEVLMTIPEMSNLVVDFNLPEAYRSDVGVGNKVIITPESLQTLKVSGSIRQIATLPVNQSFWDEMSPKVYPSTITLDTQNELLVNGMSVQIEIITDVLKDVISVPIEAIFENDRGLYAYVNQNGIAKETPIAISAANDNSVCVTQGLSEGDVVYLYRPYQKKQSE